MEKQRWEDKSQRRERVSRKKIRKEKESEERRCETLFFQCFVAPESRKVGSLKRRVRSHLQRRDDNLHAVVARSTFERQNGKNTSCSEHFWKFQCLKSTPLWREARLEVEPCKTKHVWGTFGSWDVEKVHGVVARSTFWSHKCTKHTILGPLLEVEMSNWFCFGTSSFQKQHPWCHFQNRYCI